MTVGHAELTRPLPAEPRGTGWPRVAIVTPSYNQGRFLRRTIESVLRQDYPHIDYVVIDGGSTDESVAVLRSYGRRLAWVSEPDRGQSDAINKGLARVRGDVCAYLNSDDVLYPGAVGRVAAYFRDRPAWDLVYGNADHIDADDRVLEPYPTAPYDFDRLLQNCFLCQPATFWRRAVAARVGPFDAALHYAMDFDYWLRVARAGGRLVHVPDILAGSRVHAETKTLSCRPQVYREIFHVSLKHTGTVGFSHVLAYWHHRCHERPDGWPQLLRRLPNADHLLARLHFRWLRHGGRWWPFGRDLARTALRRGGFRHRVCGEVSAKGADHGRDADL